MCRNIKTLFNFEPPATDEEIRAASLQFVRKLSGFNKPSKLNEEAFDHLQAPVARVTGWDTPYPPAALEQHYLPSVERIGDAVMRTVRY